MSTTMSTLRGIVRSGGTARVWLSTHTSASPTPRQERRALGRPPLTFLSATRICFLRAVGNSDALPRGITPHNQQSKSRKFILFSANLRDISAGICLYYPHCAASMNLISILMDEKKPKLYKLSVSAGDVCFNSRLAVNSYGCGYSGGLLNTYSHKFAMSVSVL